MRLIILIERGLEPDSYIAYGPGLPVRSADGDSPKDALAHLNLIAREAGCEALLIPIEVEEVPQQELRETLHTLANEFLALDADEQAKREWGYIEAISGSWMLRRVPEAVVDALARTVELALCYPAAVRLEEIWSYGNERERAYIASKFANWRASEEVALQSIACSMMFEHVQK